MILARKMLPSALRGAGGQVVRKGYVFCFLEGVGNMAPGGLALRFNGLDVPSMCVDGPIVVAGELEVTLCGSAGPGEERVTDCSSSVVPGPLNMLGRVSSSSDSTGVSAFFRGVFLAFLRVLFGVRTFGFLSVSSPFAST